jgi:hypothetical protein
MDDVDGRDSRVEQLAELLVGRSLAVQPGWQVLVKATPQARPLVEAIVVALARRGAHALVRLSQVDLDPFPYATTWAAHAPADLLERLSPFEQTLRETLDARVMVISPENVIDGSELSPERRLALKRAEMPFQQRLSEMPWVSCPFPTVALAQDAGLTLRQYEDVFYDACLRDWEAEGVRLRRFAERFKTGETVRIVAPGTDISLSVAGRCFAVDDGHVNLPGGEIWTSPVEDSAEGVIEFSEYPTAMNGNRYASRPVWSSTRRRATGRSSSWPHSVPTTAHGGSVNSGSAATVASPSASARRGSTRRWTALSTLRSARGFRSAAVPTSARCIGTWSRTSRTVASRSTASRCSSTARGSSERERCAPVCARPH